MMAYPRILLLTTDEGEAAELNALLSEYVTLGWAHDLRELGRLLGTGQYDALFCDWPFYSEAWNDVLRVVQEQYPDLPVIVLSRTAAEREWLQVIEAGAFDLLAPPYRERNFLAVLEQAAASRQARSWQNEEISARQRTGTA